jgi:hypothetical protein
MTRKAIASVTISALTHDLTRKRSLVVLVWDDDPEKRVSLPVSFGCSLEGLRDEAEKALRALSAEAATLAVNSAR